MIRYHCTKCDAELESPKDMAGLQERCPLCSHINKVPARGRKGGVGRQQADEAASEAAAALSASGAGHRHRTVHVPHYHAMQMLSSVFEILGYLGLVAGAIGAGVSTLLAIGGAAGPAGWMGVVAFLAGGGTLGLACLTTGKALSCLRDIARNTFRISHATGRLERLK
jgi:DNA-directed RNA polymerase subunit RPC12/RpoP